MMSKIFDFLPLVKFESSKVSSTVQSVFWIRKHYVIFKLMLFIFHSSCNYYDFTITNIFYNNVNVIMIFSTIYNILDVVYQ